MAQRFGGKHSPGGASADQSDRQSPAQPFRNARRTRAGGRVNFLFIAPLPLALRAFSEPPTEMAIMLVSLGIILTSAWLTREGLLAQDAFDARRIARRPAIPRKIFGAVLMGFGLGLAGFATTATLAAPAIFAVLGTGLHLFAFGTDPMRDKGVQGIDMFQADRVARAVEEAEAQLSEMSKLIAPLGDRPLLTQVERFQSTARDMFRTVESDPRDLSAARKFLGVYLTAARDSTLKYAQLETRAGSTNAREKYFGLLSDLETGFAEKTKQLMQDDHADLDVEIDVLRERLERDGLISG